MSNKKNKLAHNFVDRKSTARDMEHNSENENANEIDEPGVMGLENKANSEEKSVSAEHDCTSGAGAESGHTKDASLEPDLASGAGAESGRAKDASLEFDLASGVGAKHSRATTNQQSDEEQDIPPEDAPIKLNREQARKVALAEKTLGYTFKGKRVLVSAITHPSANEGKSVKYSYERLEFLGDSILGAVVAYESFHKFSYLDEGGLTRIKVALVSGTHLSDVAKRLNFEDFIIFGSSETGTGKRGLHSALENVYEALVAALYLDGGLPAAYNFIEKSLLPYMDISLAAEPENPKSALQERLQEDGITPTYKLLATQGPPHDRTFVAQVYAGDTGLAKGRGRTKKEAESQAAKTALERLGEFFARLKPGANKKLKGKVEAEEKPSLRVRKKSDEQANECLSK